MGNSGAGSSTGKVALDQVLRVAELAQLELTVDEQTDMLRDLNSILGHIAQLNELDTTEIPAMAQVSELLRGDTVGDFSHSSQDARRMGHPADDGAGGALRSDTLRASLDRDQVMAEAPDTDGTYFKVPKVIER